MCTVDKLLIKGIRSFSPDNQNVIEFYRPLTLIVGSNGAGKTTIIECLKQAVTGELPPNTRSGQSFIHDPKVAGETEVKAQIKLRFKTQAGSPVVVIRSFQLTQKKTQLQFKTLDSVLQTFNKDTGEKSAITYKCADIDRIVPNLMGVSKAVLENVIFVHQEDSNWPLAEAQVLKKKFDDIFAATKYTKALEALRKIRTEKAQAIREMKLKLDHLKTHKDAAQKLQADIQGGKARACEITKQMQELEAEIQDKNAAHASIDSKLCQMADLGDQLSKQRSQHEIVSKHTAELLAKLKDGDYEESTEELEKWKAEFHSKIDALAADIRATQLQIKNKNFEIESMKTRYAEECLQHGRLTAEAEAFKRNTAERDRFILASAAAQGIQLSATTAPLPADAVAQFSTAVKRRAAELDGQLAQMKQQNRERDQELGGQLDAKNSAINRDKDAVNAKREQQQKNLRDIELLGQQMQECDVSKVALEELRAREQETKGKLEAKQAEVSNPALQDGLEREKAALDAIAARISTLRQEREQLSNATDSQMKLKMKRQEVGAREERMSTMLAGRRSRLQAMLGGAEPELDGLKVSVDRALAAKRSEAGMAGERLRELQTKEGEVRGQLATTRSQVNSLDARLQEARSELLDGMVRALGEQPAENQFPTKLAEVVAKAEAQNGKLGYVNSLQSVLAKYRQSCDDADMCPLCMRGFSNHDEKAETLALIDNELVKLPDMISRQEERLRRVQSQAEALRGLQPLWHRYSELMDHQLPPLREKLAAISQQQQDLAAQVRESQDVLAVLEADVHECNKLLLDVVLPIHQQSEELRKLRIEVAGLEAMLAGSAAVRTVADVDAELAEADEARDRHQAQREELAKRQTRLKDEVMALSNNHFTAREALTRAMEKMKRKLEYENRLKDLERLNVELSTTVDSLLANNQPLEMQRDDLQRQREAHRQTAMDQEGALDGSLREARSLADALAAKQRPLDEYAASNKEAALADKTAQIDALQQRTDAAQQAVVQLDAALQEKQSMAAENESVKREVNDCLDYRKSAEMQKAMEAEMAVLEQQMQQVGDHKRLVEQLERIKEQRDALQQKRDIAKGSCNTEQVAIAKAERELAAPQYRDIEQRYRKQLIEQRTTEMANSDLEKYHKAVEKALLLFHTSKMTDINRVIKELWQKTYRGQDIDYIAVQADAEGQRSYNYRVVMYSGGAELEMRGRCSAGQKVLASLIIRLALAESFCLNCGILALDEPTTNLDEANSASLAEALRNIMAARREQESFQLIVITHDERFATQIGTREHADSLWRVTKDEAQHTLVRCEDIAS